MKKNTLYIVHCALKQADNHQPVTKARPNYQIRLLAGLANSLLTGNVYMAECAPSNLVPSLKQIEVKIPF